MKYSLALITALAASTSASASPLRLMTFSPVENVDAQEIEVEALPLAAQVHSGKPCHGSSSSASASTSASASSSNNNDNDDDAPYGPIGALLTRLGFAPDHPAGAVLSLDSDSGITETERTDVTRLSKLDQWKSHVEEIFNDAIPIIEGGVVRLINTDARTSTSEEALSQQDELNDVKWWRVAAGEGQWEVKDGNGDWRAPRRGERPPMGKSAHQSARLPPQLLDEERSNRHGREQEHGRPHSHHHRQRISRTLHGRLQKVISNLLPFEAIAFALVLGAGLGSIAHFIFMVLLLSYRRVRFGRTDRVARRAARKARKAAKAEKSRKASGQGEIRLEGEELLPSYECEDGAMAQIAEKA